jgi:hypothetical protein
VEQEAGGGEEGKRRSVGGLHVDNEEKMDSLQLEYTYLLTSQVRKSTGFSDFRVCPFSIHQSY